MVRVRDIATVRSTFKDAETITRLDGKPAIAIEVKKRIGANIVETIEGAKAVADEFIKSVPEGMEVTYTQDKSVFVNKLLNDLQNHVMIAVILVFIVILYALSGRASLLIGLAIPSSFLMGILALALMGYTINMIVLFSLILAVGMLVDDAIIVTEFAERRMSEGMPREQAFELAAKRMAGPVIAATMTRIAAFSPLLFWPGIIGDFMKYLPITLIVTLAASMAYALIFAPTIGALIGKAPHLRGGRAEATAPIWRSSSVRCTTPRRCCVLTVALLVAVPVAYSKYGAGVEFFPSVEPDYGLLYVHARGNLSLAEMDIATTRRRRAHPRLAGHQVGLYPRRQDARRRRRHPRGRGRRHPVRVRRLARAQVGQRHPRRSARASWPAFPASTSRCACPTPARRPASRSRCSSRRSIPTGLNDKAREVAAAVAKVPGVIDISDGLPPPGVDWALEVDRAKAAQYGISPAAVGTVVQLVTTGLKLTRLPAGRRRRCRRYPPAAARRPADAVGARPAAGRDRAGLGADLQLRRRASPNRRSASSTASTASAPITVAGQCRFSASRSRPCRPRSRKVVGEMELARHRLEAWPARTRTAPRPAPSWAMPSARRSS